MTAQTVERFVSLTPVKIRIEHKICDNTYFVRIQGYIIFNSQIFVKNQCNYCNSYCIKKHDILIIISIVKICKQIYVLQIVT